MTSEYKPFDEDGGYSEPEEVVKIHSDGVIYTKVSTEEGESSLQIAARDGSIHEVNKN